MLHGSEDGLTNPKGTEQFFVQISSLDKTFKKYPGLYHELLNEFEKEKVMDDILNWLKERI